MRDDNLILVYYIAIGNYTPGVDDNDINEFITTVKDRVKSSTIKGEMIFIPITGYNSRVECINPKYITKPALIKKHEELLNNLNTELVKYTKNE